MANTRISDATSTTPAATDLIPISRPNDSSARQTTVQGILNLVATAATSVINVTDATYGAAGDGVTDDTDAVQSAVTAALAASSPLYFPAGTYAVTMTSGETLLNLTSAIEVFGDGIDRTIISFGPEPPTIAYYGIQCTADTGHFYIHDLTLQGPTDGSGANDRDGVSLSGGYDADITIKRVKCSNQWSKAIEIGNATRTVKIIDCDLDGYERNLTQSTASGEANKLYVTRTRFRGIKTAVSTDHIAYINPGLSFVFEDCVFETIPNGGGYAVHSYGSDATEPEFAIFKGCLFEDGLDGTGAILENGNGTTQVIGCVFKDQFAGIVGQGADVIVDSCRFVGDGDAISARGGTYIVANSYFYDTGVGSSGKVEAKTANTILLISNCEFDNAAILSGEKNITGHEIHVNNCRFSGTVANQLSPGDAEAWINNCQFFGTHTEGAVYLNSANAVGVHVSDCYFDTTTESFYVAGTAPDNIVDGRNNYFAVPPTGGAICHLIPRQGMKPTATASAANLALDCNYDMFHISGTTSINNIYLGDNSTDALMFHGARIVLIADAGWDLTGAGNIVATAGAKSANDTVTLVYDAVNNTWFETATA